MAVLGEYKQNLARYWSCGGSLRQEDKDGRFGLLKS